MPVESAAVPARLPSARPDPAKQQLARNHCRHAARDTNLASTFAARRPRIEAEAAERIMPADEYTDPHERRSRG